MQESLPTTIAAVLYETFVTETVSKLDRIRSLEWISQPLAYRLAYGSMNKERYMVAGDQSTGGKIFIQEIDLTPDSDYFSNQPLVSQEISQFSVSSKIVNCRGSADSRLVAYRCEGSNNPRIISLGDLSKGMFELKELSKQGVTLRWSARQYNLIASSGNIIALWNMEQKPVGQKYPESHGDDICEMEWLSQNQFAAGTNCGNIYIWDTRIRKPVKRYSGGGVGAVLAVATCNQTYILTSDKSKDLRLWDSRKDKCFAYPRQQHEIRKLLITKNSDGEMTFVAGSESGSITLLQENPLFVHRYHSSAIRDMDSSKGVYLTAESSAPRLCIWQPNRFWQQH